MTGIGTPTSHSNIDRIELSSFSVMWQNLLLACWFRSRHEKVRTGGGRLSRIVVVLSPRSVPSDNVADEISFAIDGGKSVLPVMIERCNLLLQITRMQVIDATQNYRNALEQCVTELRRGKESASPPPLTSQPQTKVIPASEVGLYGASPVALPRAHRSRSRETRKQTRRTVEERGQRLAAFIPTAAERNVRKNTHVWREQPFSVKKELTRFVIFGMG